MKYRLSSLLILMVIAAVLIAAFPPLYDWCTNPTSVPLSRVVASFNKLNAVEHTTQELTMDEIAAAIESQLPTLVESERVKIVLRRIVAKQRVPPNTKLEHVTIRRAATDQPYLATNLHFMAGDGTPVHIRIRESPCEEGPPSDANVQSDCKTCLRVVE